MQQRDLGWDSGYEEPYGQHGHRGPRRPGQEKPPPTQPEGQRGIRASGKLRPGGVRRTHCYGVAAAGGGVRSGLYERRPLVNTTRSMAATATTGAAIKNVDPGGTGMKGSKAEVVTLKLE